MISTIFALILRIFSNPFSNVLQKRLTNDGTNPLCVNFYTYAGLSLVCLFMMSDMHNLSLAVWQNAVLGGICGALGNGFLIKALEKGDLSVLGPINSYKPIVAMIFAIFLIGETPKIMGLLGIFLIIFGTYFVFGGLSFDLLKRKEVQYRALALVFTAIEAVFIKNVIIMSNISVSFVLWCWFGMIFSFILLLVRREKIKLSGVQSFKWLFLLVFTSGIMQYSTNYVFNHMNVSYALALFQLSTVISVFFGWKFFAEENILKKLVGSLIMVFGAVILILV